MTGVETGVEVAAVVVLVLFGLLILGMCAVAGRRVVRKRESGPVVDTPGAPLFVDLHSEAYADAVGIAVAADPAPADDELPPVDAAVVNRLLVDIGRAQIRHHFKSIYGEDGQP